MYVSFEGVRFDHCDIVALDIVMSTSESEFLHIATVMQRPCISNPVSTYDDGVERLLNAL